MCGSRGFSLSPLWAERPVAVAVGQRLVHQAAHADEGGVGILGEGGVLGPRELALAGGVGGLRGQEPRHLRAIEQPLGTAGLVERAPALAGREGRQPGAVGIEPAAVARAVEIAADRRLVADDEPQR